MGVILDGAAIPEPSLILLVCLSVLGLIPRRR